MNTEDKLRELKKRVFIAKSGGGQKKTEKQHRNNKLTARERIELLLDADSFIERGMLFTHRCIDFEMQEQRLFGDGVVTGSGKIGGRLVYVYAQDFTIFGGSLGESHARKIAGIMDAATQVGAPIIGLIDSGGARIQEGLSHYSLIFRKNTEASGIVPQLFAILGPCSGGATISPSLGDFVFMVKGIGHMFAAGPRVVKTLTGEEVSAAELGGATIHIEKSGVAHFAAVSEESCFQKMRRLLSFLPSNCYENPPQINSTDDPRRCDIALRKIFSSDNYDMKSAISIIVDNADFFEIQERFAPNLIIGLARMKGKTVGIIANQPKIKNGMLDMDGAYKVEIFVRFCDDFNIPIIILIDCPGYFGGKDQEERGLIRHAARMISAYCKATVPMIGVAVKNVYGAGISGMSMSKYLGTDITFALPTAEIAVMKPEAAVNILYKGEIERSENQKNVKEGKIQEYRDKFANPYVAAEKGWIDAVIDPLDIRPILINALDELKNKRTIQRKSLKANLF